MNERENIGVFESFSPAIGATASIEEEFRSQVGNWRRDTRHVSSLSRMILHPSYRRIMGMGRDVLPLLLRELSERPDHWFVALNAITGEDPAPPNSTFNQAVEAWLNYGRQRGLLP